MLGVIGVVRDEGTAADAAFPPAPAACDGAGARVSALHANNAPTSALSTTARRIKRLRSAIVPSAISSHARA